MCLIRHFEICMYTLKCVCIPNVFTYLNHVIIRRLLLSMHVLMASSMRNYLIRYLRILSDALQWLNKLAQNYHYYIDT